MGRSILTNLLASDFISKNSPVNIPKAAIIAIGILNAANVVFSVMLYRWKKIGFWGIVGISIVALIINLSMGLGINQSLFGLVGIVVLYGILQIKTNNVKAWDNLE